MATESARTQALFLNDTGIVCTENSSGALVTLPFKVTGVGGLGDTVRAKVYILAKVYNPSGTSRACQLEMSKENRVKFHGVGQQLKMIQNGRYRKLPQWSPVKDSNQWKACKKAIHTASKPPQPISEAMEESHDLTDDSATQCKTWSPSAQPTNQPPSAPSPPSKSKKTGGTSTKGGSILDRVLKAYDGAETKNTNLKTSLEAKDTALKKLNAARSQYEFSVHEERTKLETKLKNAVQAHAVKEKGLKAQLMEREGKITVAGAKVVQQQAANNQLQGQLNEQESANTLLRRQAKEQQAIKDQLQSRCSQQADTIEELKHSKKRRCEELDELKDKFKRAKTDRKAAETEIKRLESDTQQLMDADAAQEAANMKKLEKRGIFSRFFSSSA
jgi:hypothetical protein